MHALSTPVRSTIWIDVYIYGHLLELPGLAVFLGRGCRHSAAPASRRSATAARLSAQGRGPTAWGPLWLLRALTHAGFHHGLRKVTGHVIRGLVTPRGRRHEWRLAFLGGRRPVTFLERPSCLADSAGRNPVTAAVTWGRCSLLRISLMSHLQCLTVSRCAAVRSGAVADPRPQPSRITAPELSAAQSFRATHSWMAMPGPSGSAQDASQESRWALKSPVMT